MPQALVERSKQGEMLVLSVTTLPAVAVSQGIGEAIVAGIQEGNADASVEALVIIGSKNAFITRSVVTNAMFSADLETFSEATAVVDALEGSAKPIVAALRGSVFGDGLGVALASHYRVAAEGTQLGFPEVKLGLLPGGGAAQRLTRAVGVEAALRLMVHGDPIRASQAQVLGLVDELIEGELLLGAIAYARRVADVRPLPRLSERRAEPNSAALALARAELARRAENLLSPNVIADLVEAATRLSFPEGVALERAKAAEVRSNPQSQALQHAFFAERTAAQVAGLPAAAPRELRQVGVVGAGTMGGGIAMAFLNVGIPVTVAETSQEALTRGLGIIRKNYEASAQKGRLSPDEVEVRLGRLTPSLGLGALSSVDLVVEAVFESMAVKREVFGALGALVSPDTILATNTSTLNVDEIAAATTYSERVLGLHFFSPANVMRLVEVVRAEKTSGEALAAALAVVKTLGKVGVVVGVCDGFVGNRMIHAYGREAQKLLLEGARPQEVDAAMRAFGLPMGPFEMSDMVGLDIGYAIRQYQAKVAGKPKPDGILDRIVERGRKGQKTGAGVYDYPQGRTPVPNRDVERLIADYRAERGVKPKKLGQDKIAERLVYTLVNEGAQILDEGIAQRAGDIDVIYLNGYGFPAYRGGPMYYADTRGLGNVVEGVAAFGWTPAPLLKRLAEAGGSFTGYDRENAGREGGVGEA